MKLTILAEALSVCRLSRGQPLPEPPAQGLWSLTRTADELSLICPVGQEPEDARVESPWRAMCVAGPLDFGQIGILAELSGVLARAGIPLLALGTFDTDYLLVSSDLLNPAVEALREAGHEVT